jgi:hypothetical protein
MKKFNTLQELWSYSLYCPLCKDVVRNMVVSMGPSNVSAVKTFKKVNQFLHVDARFHFFKKKYNGKLIINCVTNTFEIAVEQIEDGDLLVNKSPSSTLYLELQSTCNECANTFVVSSDIDIDLLGKTLSNFSISREGFYLLKGKSKYHVSLDHESNTMDISKCFEDDSGTIVDDNKPLRFPIINFDFSNTQKVINKIRTLLVFS